MTAKPRKIDDITVVEIDVETPDAERRLAEGDRMIVKILLNRFYSEKAKPTSLTK